MSDCNAAGGALAGLKEPPYKIDGSSGLDPASSSSSTCHSKHCSALPLIGCCAPGDNTPAHVLKEEIARRHDEADVFGVRDAVLLETFSVEAHPIIVNEGRSLPGDVVPQHPQVDPDAAQHSTALAAEEADELPKAPVLKSGEESESTTAASPRLYSSKSLSVASPATQELARSRQSEERKDSSNGENWEELLFVCGQGLTANNVSHMPKALLKNGNRNSAKGRSSLRESSRDQT